MTIKNQNQELKNLNYDEVRQILDKHLPLQKWEDIIFRIYRIIGIYEIRSIESYLINRVYEEYDILYCGFCYKEITPLVKVDYCYLPIKSLNVFD